MVMMLAAVGLGTWIVLGVLVVLVLSVIAIYNGLVAKRMLCRQAWSQIDVQLKRRHDLIPNIVSTVQGYAAHEKQTLEAVIQARNAALAVTGKGVAQQAQAENMLTGALRQLFALSEAYPNLKANENFMQLQEELTSTENRISFARQHYNDSVGVYNMGLQVFPNNLMAAPMGFQPMDFFQADGPADREVPQVKF